MDIYIIKNIVIQKDIALEINTQYLRRGGDDCFPDKEKVQLYENLGGKKIVIGSDAHITHDVFSDITATYDKIKGMAHAKAGVYVGRKFRNV